nr:unnamed protein product [Callosobruchus analis]
MSTAALQHFVTNLKSRHEQVRIKTVRELSLYVKNELREATPDEINSFLDEFYHHIFEMVKFNNDVNEKKGGILAIMCLIGADVGDTTSRFGRFANYLRKLLPCNDVGVMELVAKAMGYLAMVYGSKASEYVQFEVKRAFEWLQDDKADVSIKKSCSTRLLIANCINSYFFLTIISG